MSSRTVCLDFDGVLNTYKGNYSADDLLAPRDGVELFLSKLEGDGWEIKIHTVRDEDKVWEWLQRHGLHEYVADVAQHKPPAIAYVDDRGIQFNGDFEATLAQLEIFQPHWSSKRMQVPDLEMIWGLKADIFAEVLKRGCSLEMGYHPVTGRYTVAVVHPDERYVSFGDTLLEATHKALGMWVGEYSLQVAAG